MVDYSKFDKIDCSDDEEAPAAPAAPGYSEEERARLMAEVPSAATPSVRGFAVQPSHAGSVPYRCCAALGLCGVVGAAASLPEGNRDTTRGCVRAAGALGIGACVTSPAS
jgi:hypothetical protein